MNGDGERQAAQLEREIEETREQLDHTFDQLEERLTTQHLMEEIRTRFSGTARSLLDSAEQHPTAAIAAAAVGVLLLRRRRMSRQRSLASTIDLSADDLLRLLEARVTAAVSRASDATQRASEAAQNGSRTLGDYAGEAIDRASEGLSDAAQQARAGGEALFEQLSDTDFRPALPYALLALAIGAGFRLARSRSS